MNYGAEPADQVVRYSLEGMEYSLKITGNVAKHVAVFIAAALKDQKKTRGKTRLTRMLKEQRPMKCRLPNYLNMKVNNLITLNEKVIAKV